jgi:hypothetical protein
LEATDFWLDDHMIGVRISAGAGNFSLHHRVQTTCGAGLLTIDLLEHLLTPQKYHNFADGWLPELLEDLPLGGQTKYAILSWRSSSIRGCIQKFPD